MGGALRKRIGPFHKPTGAWIGEPWRKPSGRPPTKTFLKYNVFMADRQQDARLFEEPEEPAASAQPKPTPVLCGDGKHRQVYMVIHAR
jgi:hypothetical protein